MEKVKKKTRLTETAYLFHNSKEDIRTLAQYCNMLADKINELIDEVQELRDKVGEQNERDI